MLVSFFNPYAGFSGIVAVSLAVSFAYFTGLEKSVIKTGTYSYNALIIGIGMGTMYNYNMAYWVLLAVVVVISVVLSVILRSKFIKYGLPFLTLPFVLCMWLIQLSIGSFEALEISVRNIYWLNEMYALTDDHVFKMVLYFENLPISPLLATFFRSLSSLYFNTNILAGMVIAVGVFIHSRIVFSLIVIGFISAHTFNGLLMAHPEGMNYYLLGGNFILVCVAVGGFFTIPSFHSYLWAVVSVPICFLVVAGLEKVLGSFQLPVYSMPFCITVLGLLYFFLIKPPGGKILLTPVQHYSPEKNLYSYLNNKKRLQNEGKISLQLPFIGKWIVSQGYAGGITHKGDWSNALDFIIVDESLKTYNTNGILPEDFYCYGKPILASASGFVQQIEDFIEDNPVGKIDQEKNWGNTIIIKHSEGLYTKMSHLKKNSFKVKVGDYVKQGDIVAFCGSSGRSPEPHLHFQVQTTPFIGSKTIAYPFAFFISQKKETTNINEFSVPKEAQFAYNASVNVPLRQAFEFLPGSRLAVTAENMPEGKWEVFTDAYNHSYIYCHESKATAWFKKTAHTFYFTAFDGEKNSLLYYFYLACYKIYFVTELATDGGQVQDSYPLQFGRYNIAKWVQDIVAPFFIFSRLNYQSKNKKESDDIFDTAISIQSRQTLQFLGINKIIQNFEVNIQDNKIQTFSFQKNNQTVLVKCSNKEY